MVRLVVMKNCWNKTMISLIHKYSSLIGKLNNCKVACWNLHYRVEGEIMHTGETCSFLSDDLLAKSTEHPLQTPQHVGIH